jgi:hypothetical protein
MIRKTAVVGALVGLAVWIAACGTAGTPADPASTVAAKTMEVILTDISGQIQQSQTHAPTATATRTATPTITDTATTIPTVDLRGITPIRSDIPPADDTPLKPSPTGPTPTTDPTTLLTRTLVGKCPAAFFVDDIGPIQDYSEVKAGTAFTETWDIRNIGFCTWDRRYQLFFFSGQHMHGPDAIDFPEIVAPNQNLWLSVTLTAPQSTGVHIGRWYLRDADGKRFGVGENGDEPLIVRIIVVA